MNEEIRKDLLYYLYMKRLINYISESIYPPKISDNYKEVATRVCNELVKKLPKWPNHKDTNLFQWEKVDAGKFWWNDGDIVRYKTASTRCVGYKLQLMTTLDLESNNINPDYLDSAIEQLFNTTIKESIFDDNASKKLPEEYEYINKMYTVLKDFFKIRNFSKVPFLRDDDAVVLSGKDLKQLLTRPTIETDGFKVALWNVIADNAGFEEEKYNIYITLFIYEEKQ